MSFDVHGARAEFPILTRRVNGRPLIYLDSAASAQKPRAVMSAMTAAAEGGYANVHRGLHTLATETTLAYEGARESVRAFVNARSASEIVFTKGATEAINLVAAGLGAAIAPGDEIVLSQMEHHANIVPWHFLREGRGAVLRFIPVTDDGRLDLDAYRALLGPRTRMVAVSHMSNVLGTINPVAEIVAEAHAGGSLDAHRRGAGGGSPAGRRASAGRRLLCLLRPQALWADRHRGALRPGAAARRSSPLPGGGE